MTDEIRELTQLEPAREREIEAAIALIEGLSQDEKCAISFNAPAAKTGVSWRPADSSKVCHDDKVWQLSPYGDPKQLGVRLRGEYVFDVVATLVRDTQGGRGREDLPLPPAMLHNLHHWLESSVTGA